MFFIDPSNLGEFNPSGESLLASSAALAPLTMFAYLGLESATVPAGDVKDAARTIPRSTIIGISIAAALYVLGTVVVMGVVPREQLVHSVAPFSDAATDHVGLLGRLGDHRRGDPVVDRRTERLDPADGTGADGGRSRRPVPPAFDRLSARGVPALGIVISASLATALVLIEVVRLARACAPSTT